MKRLVCQKELSDVAICFAISLIEFSKEQNLELTNDIKLISSMYETFIKDWNEQPSDYCTTRR